MKRFIEFLKNVKKEMKLINWPTKPDIIEGTSVVIVVSAVIAVFLTIVDFVFNMIVNYIV